MDNQDDHQINEDPTTQEHDRQQSRDGLVGRRVFGRRAATTGGAILGGVVLGGFLAPEVAAAATADWKLSGNAGTVAASFLGTTDYKPSTTRQGSSADRTGSLALRARTRHPATG